MQYKLKDRILISLLITKPQKKALTKVARERNISMSLLIRSIISSYLQEY